MQPPQLDLSVCVVAAEDWEHGTATGVCQQRDFYELTPLIEVKDRASTAAVVGTLIHECAHALLHFDIGDLPERAKREIEAEAVAYCVGRYFGLAMKRSAFSLAAWQDEDVDMLHERLNRISTTVEQLIDAVDV